LNHNIICINTSDLTLTLPMMQLYDDGHVVRIKRLGPGLVKIKMSYCYTYNGTSQRFTMPCLICDGVNTITGNNMRDLSSEGDSIELVWCRDLIRTVNNTAYYGAWVEYKLPRNW